MKIGIQSVRIISRYPKQVKSSRGCINTLHHSGNIPTLALNILPLIIHHSESLLIPHVRKTIHGMNVTQHPHIAERPSLKQPSKSAPAYRKAQPAEPCNNIEHRKPRITRMNNLSHHSPPLSDLCRETSLDSLDRTP